MRNFQAKARVVMLARLGSSRRGKSRAEESIAVEAYTGVVKGLTPVTRNSRILLVLSPVTDGARKRSRRLGGGFAQFRLQMIMLSSTITAPLGP